jgi:two-component system, NtrC family, C4-dicarboxylate transport response regulator DctD
MFDDMAVFLIEDDDAVRTGVEQALQLAGFNVQSFSSAERLSCRFSPRCAGALVTDVRLPGMSGLDLLRQVVAKSPSFPVILITGYGDISMVVEAMRDGAYDFITKPFASDHLVEVVRRALEKRSLTLQVQALQRQIASQQTIEARLIGRSQGIEEIRRLILDLAETSASVLITGETGTGKELVARCLHEYGSECAGHFVALNCGGLPESLFESEIFGHEAGTFTGAIKRRIGKIEHAQKGTLFLDEIESMPCALQVKLLRVLQEQKIERLGSNNPIAVDCRVIAATKNDLVELSRQGHFRRDLYYRLDVARINIPPLRDRREDIPLLFEHFVLQAALRYQREAPIVSSAQVSELLAYDWPGNIRELHNVANRFVLGLNVGQLVGLRRCAEIPSSLSDQVSRFERCLIEHELRKQNGCVAAASEALGIPKKTLYDKIQRHQMLLADYGN